MRNAANGWAASARWCLRCRRPKPIGDARSRRRFGAIYDGLVGSPGRLFYPNTELYAVSAMRADTFK